MTTTQTHKNSHPGVRYMHALTLATEAYISQFSKKTLLPSAPEKNE